MKAYFDNSVPVKQQLDLLAKEFSLLSDHVKDLLAFQDELNPNTTAATDLYYVLPMIRMLTQQVCSTIVQLADRRLAPRRCADCHKPIPAHQTLCNCNTSRDIQ